MEFGVIEIGLCVAGAVLLGSYFAGRSDDKDELEEEWQGVVARVLVLEQVQVVVHQNKHDAPVESWTEHILVCNRDDGHEEEFRLDPEDPEQAALLALAPGSAIVKPAGQPWPRPVAP